MRNVRRARLVKRAGNAYVLLAAMHLIWVIPDAPAAGDEPPADVVIVADSHLRWADPSDCSRLQWDWRVTGASETFYPNINFYNAMTDIAARNGPWALTVVAGDISYHAPNSCTGPEQHDYDLARLLLYELGGLITPLPVDGNHDLKTEFFRRILRDPNCRLDYCTNESTPWMYTVDLPHNWRVMVLDSTYGVNGRHGDRGGVSGEQLSWAEAQLRRARQEGKKVISIAHHWLTDPYTNNGVVNGLAILDRLFSPFQDVHVMSIGAHAHLYAVQEIRDSQGRLLPNHWFIGVPATSYPLIPFQYNRNSFLGVIELRLPDEQTIIMDVLAIRGERHYFNGAGGIVERKTFRW